MVGNNTLIDDKGPQAPAAADGPGLGKTIDSGSPQTQKCDLLVRAIAAHGNVRVPVILFFLFECTLNYNLATFQSREW